MPNHPLYAQLTNVDAIALKDNPNPNDNDNHNHNPNPNDFRALKARLGAKASKNLNANLNEKLTNNNENLINPNLSENKNSRSWISRGGYWFVLDGCHAACHAQGGQNSRQNGDYRLNDVFPSFFFHGL